jgi:hypothetical protein
MPYRIAGIDVHKKMLAVVVADVEVEGAREPPLSECGFFRVRPDTGWPLVSGFRPVDMGRFLDLAIVRTPAARAHGQRQDRQPTT